MSDQGHPIFRAAPLSGQIELSTGPAPTPYHVYDGHGLIILGHCDGSALDGPFAEQDVQPVMTASGKGILVLFICDFAQASHGAHLEFHITALAAPTAGERISDDPAEALAVLATRPDWGVLSLHLWNDAPSVVAYNTEYLGLSAMRAEGWITPGAGRLSFGFADVAGQSLIEGDVRLNTRSDAGLMLRVLRHLGWRGFWQAAQRKPAEAHVINRKCSEMPRNGRAQTTTAPDKMVVTAFDAGRDRLEAGAGPLAPYRFTPLILEHLWPFRFVYQHPDAGQA